MWRMSQGQVKVTRVTQMARRRERRNGVGPSRSGLIRRWKTMHVAKYHRSIAGNVAANVKRVILHRAANVTTAGV